MKKSLMLLVGVLVSTGAFAQHYESIDVVLTPDQLRLTAEAAPKQLFVKPKKARNILVYSRTDGFRHSEGIPAWNAMMSAMEKNFAGQWKVTFSEDRNEFEADKIKKYDCIVFNNSTGMFLREFPLLRAKMTNEQKKADDEIAAKLLKNIIDYANNGGGIMALHAGCDAQHGSEYVTMMGGLFAGHPWGAGNDPVTVLVEDPNNILLKGLWPEGEFKIQDEIYTFMDGYDRSKQRILLSLDFDRSPKNGGADPMKETRRKDKDFGLSWVKTYGKGRIFYGAFGHRLDVFWRNPKVVENYMRGIQFACGDIEGVETKPLGMEAMHAAEAKAAVSGIRSLQDIGFNTKEKNFLNIIEPVFFRAYQAITTSPEASDAVERLCVDELKAKNGTLRYKKLLSELLQVTGANSTAVQVGEIITRDAADKGNRYYVESLFISLARSTDKNASQVLLKLAASPVEFVRLSAVTALSYQNPAESLKFFIETFAKANNSNDANMAWAAVSAMPRANKAEAVKAMIAAYNTAKNPMIKTQAGQLVFAHSELDGAAALAFATEVHADSKAGDGLRTLAAIELVKNGKDIKDDVILANVIRFLGNFKDVKIPASLALEKLPEHLRPEMIYALVSRGEGYDKIIALTPTSAGTVMAMAYAVSEMGKVEDIEKIAGFANLLDRSQLRSTAFSLASIRSKGKLNKLTAMSSKLEGAARELIVEAMSNIDASSSVDYLFEVVKGGGSEADKLAALKTLENAVMKNTEVFVRASELYNSAQSAIKKGILGLMVATSRRDTDEAMVKAATKLFDAAKDKAEKVMLLRFGLANMQLPGVEMNLHAYKQGLKAEALAELAKWNNESALAPLMELAKSTQDTAEKKAIQAAIVSVIMKSGSVDSVAANYIVSNAVDTKDAKTVSKLKRLNLGNSQMIKLPGGIEGTSSENPNELKNAFDGNLGSRWTTGKSREPGQWIQFELPRVRVLEAIILELGSSPNDGIVNPIVYAGESIEDFDEVKIKHTNVDGRDILTFATPKKVKLIRIENGGSKGGWWSVHEIVLVDDPSTFKNMVPVGNGMTAGASHNEKNVKSAFDGNINTRWDTGMGREAGQWFQIGLANPQKVSAVELHLGSSRGDRVLDPKIFAGETIEKMKLVKTKYEKEADKDVIILEGSPTVKFIRIENTKTSGGFWSIHEVKIRN